jgi:nitrite reductase/ring-hydroxylating ferredoxin subunit
MQYYREHAKWLECTYDFVPRVGIDHLRAVVVDDSEGIADRLDAALAASVDPVCPHRGGPLAEGLTGGTMVVCPLHAWTFDLVTGCCAGGTEAVGYYPARVEDGQLVVHRT